MAISKANVPVKKRILLVDDDEDIAEALHLLLSEHYSVDIVANGAEALQRVHDNDYDAIVLDLMMPVMDGAALKQRLDEESVQVPVLLMSSTTELPQRAAELGVDDFIAKPLDLGALERRLAALLGDHAA
jgi:DNA-binding response OmpR family regulator